jgi:hypothetical protein
MARSALYLWSMVVCGLVACRSAPPAPATRAEPVVTSVYTPLSGAGCSLVRHDREADESTQRCPGVAGYAILVQDADARMSVTLVAPDGREQPLNYWSVITRSFSRLGEHAEWRVRNGAPVALIVPVIASEDPDTDVEYLAVARVGAAACVTDRIAQGPSAGENARRAADSSAERTCLGDMD